MSILNLAEDLSGEILTRVPLKSMRSVRLTCKKWNALLKSRRLTKMHLDREEASARELVESRMIVMKDYNLTLMSVIVNDNPSTEAKGTLTSLNDSEQIEIGEVFHCEGLLLCILKDDLTKVVVWNPYLGQTRSIITKYCERYRFMYAIGYENNKNKSCRNHKILRFIDHTVYEDHFLQFEIYDFDSDLWKTLDVTPHWRISVNHCGISLKGNTYWCATRRNSYGMDRIICFDFTRERFGPLMPLPFRVGHFNGPASLSCVREEKLAALYDDIYMIEIWIASKIEVHNVSWSIFLTVDMGQFTGFGIIDGSFCIDEEKEIAMVFEKNMEERLERVKIFGEDGYLRELALGEPSDTKCLPLVCSYVPSLVQIKQHEGCKRKGVDMFEGINHEGGGVKKEKTRFD